jgi:hypothetical protein
MNESAAFRNAIGAGFFFSFFGFFMGMSGFGASPVAAGATMIAGAILVGFGTVALSIRRGLSAVEPTTKAAFVPDELMADALDRRDD